MSLGPNERGYNAKKSESLPGRGTNRRRRQPTAALSALQRKNTAPFPLATIDFVDDHVEP
jgi:hypothetical protein